MSSQFAVSHLSNAFPSYLAPIFKINYASLLQQSSLPSLLVLLVFLVIVLFFLQYVKIKRILRKDSVFLEVKPTYHTQQSAFSTNQLFTAIHSLERNRPFIDKLLGIKQTISCELVATKEKGIRYILKVPRSDMTVIQKVLRSHMAGIEIQEIEDYLPLTFTDISTKEWTIRKFKLFKPFVIPLQEHTKLNEYDPIGYLTGQMTKLQHDELITLQLVCTPVSDTTHGSVAQHIHRLRTLMDKDIDIIGEMNNGISVSVMKALIRIVELVLGNAWLLFCSLLEFIVPIDSKNASNHNWLLERPKKKPLHQLGEAKQELHKKIASKINQPLFEVNIRLFVAGNSPEMIRARVNGINSSLHTFSTPDQTIKQKIWLPFIYKFPYLRKLFYFTFHKRLLVGTNSPILSVTELSSLYHFPFTGTTKTEDLINVKSPKLPPPLSLKSSPNNFDINFAHNTYGETTVPIGLTLEERRRHVYMIGATGTGKTTTLLHMIYQDIVNGKGIAVIDPHGDLIERLLAVIPKERIQDVVYFNPYDIEYPFGLNILELAPTLTPAEKHREKDLIASSMVSIFHKLYTTRYTGPRMEHILRNAVLTALELPSPTLGTIYRLLTNTEFRKQSITGLQNKMLKDFWIDEFGKLGSFQKAEQISPITNKLGRFLTTTMTHNILNQPKSTLDFDNILNTQKIVLCDLSKGKIGEDTSSFLGSLLIAKLQLAALKRVHLPLEKRLDFFVYIDEFQNFATPSFAQILSEARKYRLNTILAHQTISQIEDIDLFKVILANVGTVISFRTSNPTDEDMILPLFAPQVEKHEISNLPPYHFYMKIHALEPQNAFTGAVEDFTVKENQEIRQAIVSASQKRYGLPQLEIIDDVIKPVKKKIQKRKKSKIKQKDI